MFIKNKKILLFIRALKRKLRAKFDEFTQHEPVVKSEAISRTLYLLTRDFTLQEQNEIVIELIEKLREQREKDIISLEKQINEIRTEDGKFRAKVVLT